MNPGKQSHRKFETSIFVQVPPLIHGPISHGRLAAESKRVKIKTIIIFKICTAFRDHKLLCQYYYSLKFSAIVWLYRYRDKTTSVQRVFISQ